MSQVSDFTPVEGASDYSLSNNGYVYNVKTRQRLARTWIDMGWQTQVKDDAGDIRRIRHDDPDSRTRTLPHDSYTPIPDYPDYVVTPYGAVWKIANLIGRGGRHPFIVQESYRGNQPYVRLRSVEGKKHNIPMSRIMNNCFPNP
tara:strand:- start:2682 stop:3113 length:432 start_codon:yes stop_codon:yes gene_type:complete